MMTKKDLLAVSNRFNDLVVKKSWPKEKIREAIFLYLESAIKVVTSDLEHHEKHSNSYFWEPPSNTSSRRNEENRKSFENSYLIDGNLYEYSSSVSCSCKNYYYTGYFSLDGEKKDVRIWKKLLGEIQVTLQGILPS